MLVNSSIMNNSLAYYVRLRDMNGYVSGSYSICKFVTTRSINNSRVRHSGISFIKLVVCWLSWMIRTAGNTDPWLSLSDN